MLKKGARPTLRAPMSTAPVSRLLFVENDYLVAEFSRDLLAEMGYDVLCVPARAAVSVVDDETFDLALLDIEPRDKLVHSVAARLQRIGTPIVLLADHPQFIPSALREHAVLLKPFHWPELYSAIKTLARNEDS